MEAAFERARSRARQPELRSKLTVAGDVKERFSVGVAGRGQAVHSRGVTTGLRLPQRPPQKTVTRSLLKFAATSSRSPSLAAGTPERASTAAPEDPQVAAALVGPSASTWRRRGPGRRGSKS